MVELLLIKP